MVVSLSGADAFKSGRLDGNIPGQSGYMLRSPFLGQSAGKAEKSHYIVAKIKKIYLCSLNDCMPGIQCNNDWIMIQSELPVNWKPKALFTTKQ
jgi:hypothetical protein